jgi:hypothetical protein
MSIEKNTLRNILCCILVAASPSLCAAASSVTADNFQRAESDIAIKRVYDQVGFCKILHNYTPTPMDEQTIIRMNRDTLYSFAVVDLTNPVKVAMPETDGRYMSLHVINQDHFSRVYPDSGTYEIVQEDVGTPYGYVLVRTFVDMSDEKDIATANALQDQIGIECGPQASSLDVPDWDEAEAKKVRDALLILSSTLTDTSDYFGQPEDTTPVHHLIGSATGWAGQPKQNAMYTNFVPPHNDGTTPHSMTVNDVPVDAFWSITVYREDGLIEPNPRNVYAYNDRTATPNNDGSYTINFGDCDSGKQNCLEITKGWNYIFRMYEPREEIISGTWTVPDAEPVN